MHIDVNGEWKLLSSLFTAPEALHRISEHLFTDDRIYAYDAIQSAHARYGDITLEGVRNTFGKKLPPELTINAVINQTAMIDHLAQLSRRRQLQTIQEQLQQELTKSQLDESRIQKLLQPEPILPETDAGLHKAIRNVLTDLKLKRTHNYQWVETGIKTLDNMMGEWQPQSINLVMASPGSGKTALALQSMHFMATQGHRCKFVSLEMSKEQLLLRLVANIRSMDYGDLISGELTDDQIREVEDCLHYLETLPIEITDNSAITLGNLINDLHVFASAGGKVVFIDYAQIFNLDSDNRVQALGDLARQLKGAAKKLGLRVILLSQINDQNEGLAAIRDSRELAHVCDVIFQIEADKFPDLDGNRTISLMFHKNKFGRTGRAAILFKGTYQRFVDGE